MTAGPVLVGLQGPDLQPEERELLSHPQVGGVVLFARNYTDPEQLAGLVAAIHDLRPPLLVCVDHEGGRVQRFGRGFTAMPAPSLLGRLYDIDPAEALAVADAHGRLMALELRAVGIDVDFAPVIDLGRNDSDVLDGRTLHADTEVVSRLALAMLRGMHEAGIAAVAKHFPGHGGVRADSHHELPIDERQLVDLEFADLVPFARLANNGLEAVMAAHVVYPHIDPRPAGYSPFWLRDLLRGRLGFAGAIFSDDLQMTAAAWAGDLVDRTEAALEAGCDAILVCQNQAEVGVVLDRLEGRIDPVGRLRLARLRKRRAPRPWQGLRRDPERQRLRRRLIALDRFVNPEIPL